MTKVVTQENVRLYAEASHDFNPVHLDEEFARKAGLGGTVAHGMLILSYVSEMMTTAFGKSWLAGGRLDVRFREPARPDNTIAVGGKISKLERIGGQTMVTCSVLCSNEKGEQVITGEAVLTVPEP
jgi:acyl dehydratase